MESISIKHVATLAVIITIAASVGVTAKTDAASNDRVDGLEKTLESLEDSIDELDARQREIHLMLVNQQATQRD